MWRATNALLLYSSLATARGIRGFSFFFLAVRVCYLSNLMMLRITVLIVISSLNELRFVCGIVSAYYSGSAIRNVIIMYVGSDTSVRYTP